MRSLLLLPSKAEPQAQARRFLEHQGCQGLEEKQKYSLTAEHAENAEKDKRKKRPKQEELKAQA